MTASEMRVSAVVLAYGAEPYLRDCVDAVLQSRGVDVEVLLVDNGADAEQVSWATQSARVRLIEPGSNLGYAEGCNVAARLAKGGVLAFVNSDAVVEPDCLSILARAVAEPEVGLASASIRLGDDPELMNSAGNPVHFLFFSWTGGFGQPAVDHARREEVASISGATFAVRRALWEQLGGFDGAYFAYGEDVDLSWRAWQHRQSVVYEPAAVSIHHYDFSRNSRKLYLLERNRLINLLTLYESRTLRFLVPAVLAVEMGTLFIALRDGWLRQKVEGWIWVIGHRDYLRRRRRRVQTTRLETDAQLMRHLHGRLDPPAEVGITVPKSVNSVLDRYWSHIVNRTVKKTMGRSCR
jgi:GT2 family glycosyltransferase